MSASWFEGRVRLVGSILLLGLAAACHRGSAVGGGAQPVAAIGAPAASCEAPVASSAASLADTPISDPLVTFDTAWAIIARTHWDTTYNGVNWKALRDTLRPRAAAAKTTGELRGVLSGMLASLKQSHFSIIPREVSDATTSGGSGGGAAVDQSGTIGATLRYLDGGIIVTEVPAGSAAAQAGVRTGWLVEAVKGCPMAGRLARIPRDMDPRRAALTAFSLANQMLAGPVGESVPVTFRDGDGRLRDISIVRGSTPGTLAKFGNLPPFSAQLTHERVRQGGKTIGIIRFNIWMPVLSPQFDAAMDSLRDTDAILLDIRGNFGGVGGMSMGIAGHFLDSARMIGTMHQRGSTYKFLANPRRVDTRSQAVTPFAGPLGLLVDELSVSTTEIFAGGLQALGRARVFGTQTSGQALPSVPERLPNGDILYHAIADFTSPTGKPLEGDGVTPNVVTKSTRKALLEGKDPTREAALAWAVQAAKSPPKGITP
jgi:carboxyl-terminal processing protease